MSELAAVGHYVVYGPGVSGDTDDMNEARMWLANDASGQARLYVQVNPQDDLVHTIAAAMCPPEAPYCRERMIEEGDAAEIAAAVEAAGWGPRTEAVTYTEVNQFGMDLFGVFGDMRHAFVPEIWDDRARTVLMSDVLRSRGITVEGAK